MRDEEGKLVVSVVAEGSVCYLHLPVDPTDALLADINYPPKRTYTCANRIECWRSNVLTNACARLDLSTVMQCRLHYNNDVARGTLRRLTDYGLVGCRNSPGSIGGS